MKKLALVIGASAEACYAINIAQKRGYHVTAFDGNPNALGLKQADTAFVTDIRKPQNIVNLLKDKPAFVLPVPIGRYLTTTGAVNDILGLKGISKSAAENCTDKYIFHRKLASDHLRSGFCRLIPAETSITKQTSAFENICYPFILKPRYGSGSKGVYLIGSENEWHRISASVFPASEDYIAETVYEGTEYGADGFIFDGKLYLLLIREKLLTNPPFCQCVGYFSLNRKDNAGFYQKTSDYLQRVTEVLQMNNCLFHCDFIGDTEHTDIIEISGRPSGHNLHNLFTPLVTGISMIDTYIDFMEGKPLSIELSTADSMLIGYFDFENCTVKKVPSQNEISECLKESLMAYECHMKPGYAETITDGTVLMRRGFYILKGNGREELLAKRAMIKNCFETVHAGTISNPVETHI